MTAGNATRSVNKILPSSCLVHWDRFCYQGHSCTATQRLERCGDAELPLGDVGSMGGGAPIAGVNEALNIFSFASFVQGVLWYFDSVTHHGLAVGIFGSLLGGSYARLEK